LKAAWLMSQAAAGRYLLNAVILTEDHPCFVVCHIACICLL